MESIKAGEVSVMEGGKLLVLDPQLAGISGDMLLAALLDLGAGSKRVRESVRSVSRFVRGCESVDLVLSEVKRGEFRARRAEVKVREKYGTRTGGELLDALKAACTENSLSQFSEKLAVGSLQTLVEAEAALHGEKPDEVELDEAGSADTVADILGIATAMEELGIGRESEVYALPIAVGGGLFKFSHGIVQSPPPAVMSIASHHHLPIIGGPVKSELATPTGVSILANIVTKTVDAYPLFAPAKVGYGAGRRDFAEFPNVLRVILGQHSSSSPEEEVTVLETNLDDVSGEVVGFLMERLLEEGALDAHAIPAVGKKSRPAQVLRVICKPDRAEKLLKIILEESGTLGVRTYSTMRGVVSREIRRVRVVIGGQKILVKVKVSRDVRGEIIKVKPEYDDLARLARRLGMPLRSLSEMVVSEASEQLGT